MKEKLRKMMQGRYGMDELSQFLMVVGMAVMILASIVNNGILSFIGYAAVIFVYVRVFSKNYHKCYAQNQKYLLLKNRVRGYFWKKKSIMNQRKTHRIYACPSCKQNVRVPKGRGKVEIRCPKCSTKFVKKA